MSLVSYLKLLACQDCLKVEFEAVIINWSEIIWGICSLAETVIIRLFSSNSFAGLNVAFLFTFSFNFIWSFFDKCISNPVFLWQVIGELKRSQFDSVCLVGLLLITITTVQHGVCYRMLCPAGSVHWLSRPAVLLEHVTMSLYLKVGNCEG